MGRFGDQVVFRGEDVLVAPSVEVVWAPSRGVKGGSIGSYSVKVVGCMRGGGRTVRTVAVMLMTIGGVVRQAVALVLREWFRVTFDGRGIERQIVVTGVVLWLLGSGNSERELSGTSGDVGAVGRTRRGRRRGGSYGQARVPAKILLFSIASVHSGLNITPAGRRSLGSS